jgi:hypothetical protein
MSEYFDQYIGNQSITSSSLYVPIQGTRKVQKQSMISLHKYANFKVQSVKYKPNPSNVQLWLVSKQSNCCKICFPKPTEFCDGSSSNLKVENLNSQMCCFTFLAQASLQRFPLCNVLLSVKWWSAWSTAHCCSIGVGNWTQISWLI